ncbi:25253_t:CDS:2, partial [Gigaspora margarita]
QSNKEKDLEVSTEHSVIFKGGPSSLATQITSKHHEEEVHKIPDDSEGSRQHNDPQQETLSAGA